MGFAGTAVLHPLGARQIRITGVNLPAKCVGTITNFGIGGDIELPVSFPTFDVDYTKVQVQQTTHALMYMLIVSKNDPFTTISIENPDAMVGTGSLEIYVEAVHSINA